MNSWDDDHHVAVLVRFTFIEIDHLTQYYDRHYGAEVIKVEPPNVGDPLRVWRELDVDGVSPWWRSIARNKKSVTIDMRKEDGRRSGLDRKSVV